MFDLLLSKTLEVLIDLGYPGLFIVSLGFPVPTEIVIAVQAAAKDSNIWMISLVSALGGVVGSLLTYLLGYIFTIKNPDTWLGGKAKILKIDIKEIEKSRKKVVKSGFFYIFFTRFVPWLKVVASIAAGFFRINIFVYFISVFLGTYIYSILIAYLGLKIGNNIDTLKKYINLFDKWLILIVLAYLVISIGYKNRKRISQLIKSLIKR